MRRGRVGFVRNLGRVAVECIVELGWVSYCIVANGLFCGPSTYCTFNVMMSFDLHRFMVQIQVLRIINRRSVENTSSAYQLLTRIVTKEDDGEEEKDNEEENKEKEKIVMSNDDGKDVQFI
uniref:Uncharacterized protein n=1 Tax=Solanum tuberosum TaxID=4113 RepID=M1DWB9_SOLTU